MNDRMVVAVAKGRDRYVWIYDDEHTDEFCRSVLMAASNPQLNFDWDDVERVGRAIVEQQRDFINVRIAE